MVPILEVQYCRLQYPMAPNVMELSFAFLFLATATSLTYQLIRKIAAEVGSSASTVEQTCRIPILHLDTKELALNRCGGQKASRPWENYLTPESFKIFVRRLLGEHDAGNACPFMVKFGPKSKGKAAFHPGGPVRPKFLSSVAQCVIPDVRWITGRAQGFLR